MIVKLPWDIMTVYSEVLRTGVNAKEDEDEDEDEVEAHEDSIARLRVSVRSYTSDSKLTCWAFP